jgi:hypothetical protein
VHIPLASAKRVALFKSWAAPPQARNIRLEEGPDGIAVGDFIQAADAVDDICQPAQQDRDEAGNRAESEGRCRCLHHHLRELTCVRHKVHMSATSIWDMATWLRRRLYSGDEIDQTAIQSPGTHLLFAKSRLPNHEPAAKGNG